MVRRVERSPALQGFPGCYRARGRTSPPIARFTVRESNGRVGGVRCCDPDPQSSRQDYSSNPETVCCTRSRVGPILSADPPRLPPNPANGAQKAPESRLCLKHTRRIDRASRRTTRRRSLAVRLHAAGSWPSRSPSSPSGPAGRCRAMREPPTPPVAVTCSIAGSVCEAHELRAAEGRGPESRDRDSGRVRQAVALGLRLSVGGRRVGSRRPRARSSRSPSATSTTPASSRSSASTATRVRTSPRPPVFPRSSSAWAATRSSRPSTTRSRASASSRSTGKQKKPIEWVQIHRVPEHVQFRHNRHVQAGVECQTCHGPTSKRYDKLPLVDDSHIGYLVPVAKLEMGWCINCHRQNNQQASQDCLKCHY